MVSIAALAALGALAGAGGTAIATGDASMLANSIPPGLHVALSHVPTWTHAHQVLTSHLQQYTQNSSIGAASVIGIKQAIIHLARFAHP